MCLPAYMVPKDPSLKRVNFEEDLSYFVILQYKLRDLIKICNDFVNDLAKRGFSEDFVTISDRQEKFGGI